MKTGILLFLAVSFTLALRAQLTVTELIGFGAGGDPEITTWVQRVSGAGGTFETNSVAIATALLAQLRTKSFDKKVVYLLPLLGSNLAAARVPLRDTLNAGIATNTGFVDGDFSQSTGLQGDGASKILNSLVKPSQLGSSNNGGLGFWELATPLSGSSNVEPIGCYSNLGTGDYRYCLLIRASTTRRLFWWGSPNYYAGDTSVAAEAGHYYGQRSSNTSRALYLAGSNIGANNSSEDSATGIADNTIRIMGCYENGDFPYGGRCGVAYMTNGTLTELEIADLHALLRDYLITPTGR